MSAHETLSALVAAKAEALGVSLTLGYIGNTYGNPGTPIYRDDRLWMIWMDGVRHVSDNNKVVVLRGRTGELKDMARLVENGAVELRLLSVAQGRGRFRAADINDVWGKTVVPAAESAAAVANAQARILASVTLV